MMKIFQSVLCFVALWMFCNGNVRGETKKKDSILHLVRVSNSSTSKHRKLESIVFASPLETNRRLKAQQHYALETLNRQLSDDCPIDCPTCDQIRQGPARGNNRYPCDEDEDDCCGDNCRHLGETLTYLEDYVEYLKPLVSALKEEEQQYSDKLSDMVKNNVTLNANEIKCTQRQIGIRHNIVEAMRGTLAHLQTEEAIVRSSFIAVFSQCMDNTWCENDDTQEKLDLDDKSVWEYLAEAACYVAYYALQKVLEFFDLSWKIVTLPWAIFQFIMCEMDFIKDAFIDAAADIMVPDDFTIDTSGSDESSQNSMVYSINKFFCDFTEILDDGTFKKMFNGFCILNDGQQALDQVDQSDDQGKQLHDAVVKTVEGLLGLAWNGACGQIADILSTLLLEPAVCAIDTCASLPDLVDCDDYFVGNVIDMIEIIAGTFVPPPPDVTLPPTNTKNLYVNLPGIVLPGTRLPSGYQLLSANNLHLFRILENGIAEVMEVATSKLKFSTSLVMDAVNGKYEWEFTLDGKLQATDVISRAVVFSAGDSTTGAFLISDAGLMVLMKKDEFKTVWTNYAFPSPEIAVVGDVYVADDQTWEIKSYSENYRLVKQTDGNLVLYSSTGVVKMSSDTDGNNELRFDANQGELSMECTDSICWFDDDWNAQGNCDSDNGPHWLSLSDAGSILITSYADPANPWVCYSSITQN